MTIAREPNYHGALIDTETVVVKIKEVVLNDLQAGKSDIEIRTKVKKLIDDFCAEINDTVYKARARLVLVESFKRWYSMTNAVMLAVPFLILRRYSNVPPKVMQSAERQFKKLPPQVALRVQRQIPIVEYAQEYHDAEYRRKMKQAYLRYAVQLADDPARYNKNVSLRNLAEVEVRRQEVNDALARLRSQGVCLAWASSHVDCSQRCAPWQGRLYSLDGTSGTVDGIPFIPIETAINVVDKYGYINGLFGFNCRHRLIPYYKGLQPTQDYSHAQMAKERAIDKRQRELERTIRKWKERGFVLRKGHREESLSAFAKAREWTEVYKKYSIENGREYYPERITLLREEIQHKTK